MDDQETAMIMPLFDRILWLVSLLFLLPFVPIPMAAQESDIPKYIAEASVERCIGPKDNFWA